MRAEEDLIKLDQILTKAKRSSFGKVTPDEKTELIELSRKRPNDLVFLKDGSRSKVGEYRLASGREVVLKYYYPTHWVKGFRNRLIQTRCKRSWIAAHGFANVGIPTPAALAMIEHFQFGIFNTMSFLVTERAKGVQLRLIEESRHEAVVSDLKAAFQTMADFRIAHGDLKNTNIIVDEQDQITFVDLDATRFQLKGKSWDQARAYDRFRFQKNWRDNPLAAKIFKACFA